MKQKLINLIQLDKWLTQNLNRFLETLTQDDNW